MSKKILEMYPEIEALEKLSNVDLIELVYDQIMGEIDVLDPKCEIMEEVLKRLNSCECW